MRSATLFAGILSVMLFGHLATARADFIYTNFGPGDSFNTGTGSGNAWPINNTNGPAPNTRQDIAMAFVPTVANIAQSFSFAASMIEGTTLQAYLTNTTGAEPSAVPITDIVTFANVPTTPTILSANFAIQPLLAAGTQYWLVVRSDPATVPITAGWWHVNSIGATGSAAIGNTVGGWQTVVTGAPLGAFSVSSAAVVPEPGSFALAGLAASSLLGYGWRRRKTAA